MNIKNNKGVTLTILIITIIIMMILFGITFSTGTSLLKNSQKDKMKSMLYMVQSRAEILLDEYLFEHDNGNGDLTSVEVEKENIESELGGKYIENVSEIKSVGYESNSIPQKGEMIYCSWDEKTLESQGIDTKNLAQGDTIIVQYNLKDNEVNVASTKGIAIDGKTIHILKDF